MIRAVVFKLVSLRIFRVVNPAVLSPRNKNLKNFALCNSGTWTSWTYWATTTTLHSSQQSTTTRHSTHWRRTLNTTSMHSLALWVYETSESVGLHCEYTKRPTECWVTLSLYKTYDRVLGHIVNIQNIWQSVGSHRDYTKRTTECWVTLWLYKTYDRVLGHIVNIQNIWQSVGSHRDYTKRMTECWVILKLVFMKRDGGVGDMN
jgi:hypothetical protein